jgi:hypothetical protein
VYCNTNAYKTQWYYTLSFGARLEPRLQIVDLQLGFRGTACDAFLRSSAASLVASASAASAASSSGCATVSIWLTLSLSAASVSHCS